MRRAKGSYKEKETAKTFFFYLSMCTKLLSFITCRSIFSFSQPKKNKMLCNVINLPSSLLRENFLFREENSVWITICRFNEVYIMKYYIFVLNLSEWKIIYENVALKNKHFHIHVCVYGTYIPTTNKKKSLQ